MIKHYVTIGVVSLIVIAAIIYGFNSSGSPFETRARNFDAKRISDISTAKFSIESYYSTNSKLPTNLTDLKLDTNYSSTKDPETNKAYYYEVTGTKTYKLCATFNFESKPNDPISSGYNQEFKHPKGYHCFDLTIPNVSAYSPIKVQANSILDERIDYLTTDATKKQTNLSNFPYGFFSDDMTEFGLIDFASEPVAVRIVFKKPVKIQSISNIFTNCPSTDCYNWSAIGMTSTTQIDLIPKTVAQSEVASTVSVSSAEEFTWIKITATRNAGDKYVHWKKITIVYK